MEIVSADYHTYETKKVSEDTRFAFMSDVHVGGAQTFGTLEKVVDEINQLNLNFVVLGGDIVDDYTSKEEMAKAFEVLGKINTQVYYVYGNHDRQEWAPFYHDKEFTETELQNEIKKNHIAILANEVARINKDIVIMGRKDELVEEAQKDRNLRFPNKDEFNIAFDHQPHDKSDTEETNPDLQVSGHSHAGQLWPLNFVYELFGYDSLGEYRYGNTILYVSPGEGGWKIPIRTSSKCCYEVFTIKSEKGAN